MGAWGSGPFDNDSAADWSNELDDAEPEQRPTLIHDTLAEAVNEDDDLDIDVACAAIAAAAIVAAHRPGGPVVQSAYAPDFLASGELLDLPDEYADLALRALDRVFQEDSEWLNLWEEGGGLAEVTEALAPLRAALAS
ncbi:DUF4259 domain-containing protein [Solihabitans fulvus]|uniref:DUF4259 domain-containing protein n=1 Tax=Solihabitans fulvus TaxID=1892852 RepID=A0A5B2XCT4_9PSEU|nr:DUF4259 domain-containing protein [Solihabitans fulvus]KAA2260976.1 DUF4259 domain-containing protein [Solihabitans fulvus]